MEITDAPLSNALASITSWRKKHICVPPEKDIQATHGMPGDLDRAIGFTAEDYPAKKYDPWEDRK